MGRGKNKQGDGQQQNQANRQHQQHQGGRPADGMQHYSAYIQVLATDMDHVSPSLLLFVDKEGRYLFNAGEGLQRMFRENKLKMIKLENYFFTRVATDTMSGLPGMLLSSGPGPTTDAGGLLEAAPTCTLYGPTGLQQYVRAFQPYINQEQALKLNEIGPAAAPDAQPLIKTKFFTVTPLMITPAARSESSSPPASPRSAAADAAAHVKVAGAPAEAADGAEVAEEGERQAKRQRIEGPGAATQAASVDHPPSSPSEQQALALSPPPSPSASSPPPSLIAWPGTGSDAIREGPALCYVCEFAGMPGKFDLQEAIKLGVKKGPAFGELQRGRPVTLDDGSVVEPQQVMNPPSVAGPLLLVVDVPSERYLGPLTTRLAPWAEQPAGEAAAAASGARPQLRVVAHLSPLHVVQSPAYQAWMASLGSGWHHTMACTAGADRVTLRRATMLQCKLHCLHPQLYPLLQPTSCLQGGMQQQEEGQEGEAGAAEAAAAAPAAAAGAAASSSSSYVTPHAAAVLSGIRSAGVGGTLVAGANLVKMHLTPLRLQGLDAGDVPGDVDTEQVQEEFNASAADLVARAQQAVAAGSGSGAGADAAADVAAGSTSEPAAEAHAAAGTEAAPAPAQASGAAAAGAEAAAEAHQAATSSMEVDAAAAPADDAAAAPVEPAESETPAAQAADPAAAAAAPGSDGGAAAPAAEAAAEAMEVESSGADASGAAPAEPRSDPSKQELAITHSPAPAIPVEKPVPEVIANLGRDELELTFLGTASSQPSKYRNVTAIYADLFDRGGLLIDCGEDALGQLKRRFGWESAEARLRSLAAVWVSHMHADHHGGLYHLLAHRTRLMGRAAKPLLVIGPLPLFPVLVAYQKVVPISFHFLPNSYFAANPSAWSNQPLPQAVIKSYEHVKRRLGLTRLEGFNVVHTRHAYGLLLEGLKGWRVVFSGDTRPCPQTIQAASGAHLLIHEATFEDEMREDAVRKRHSTTGEALGVGQQAGVYRTVLTHFSTRYPEMPAMDLVQHPDVTIATDFMALNLADLPWLPRITPALAELFRREQEGWEQDEAAPGPAPAASAKAAAPPAAGADAKTAAS